MTDSARKLYWKILWHRLHATLVVGNSGTVYCPKHGSLN